MNKPLRAAVMSQGSSHVRAYHKCNHHIHHSLLILCTHSHTLLHFHYSASVHHVWLVQLSGAGTEKVPTTHKCKHPVLLLAIVCELHSIQ